DKLHWTEETKAAFQLIKKIFDNQPSFRSACFSTPFCCCMRCFSQPSETSRSAALPQSGWPIAFKSKKLTKKENSSIFDMENLKYFHLEHSWSTHISKKHFQLHQGPNKSVLQLVQSEVVRSLLTK
ncbi:hypothetical protein KI387_035624, partial [Taxus chinensis]